MQEMNSCQCGCCERNMTQPKVIQTNQPQTIAPAEVMTEEENEMPTDKPP